MKKNYYEILEVEPDASGEKIKEQYLFLVQAWHPDKFSKADQKARAEEKIKELNGAYQVLGSPAKRADYDSKLQSSKKAEQKPPPPRQAAPLPKMPRPKAAPASPILRRPVQSRGLFGSLGVFGREAPASERVRVLINGRPQILSVDELVHARVQYFLHGESKGIIDFNSRQHVLAAVGGVAGPQGFEIHVLRLAPYRGRPELSFTPKVRGTPGR